MDQWTPFPHTADSLGEGREAAVCSSAHGWANTNYGGTSAKIYTRFKQNTAFVMQNFQNLGASRGGGESFLTKPPKGTSLADLTRFEPLIVQIRSRMFSLDEPTKKKDITKSHVFAGNSPPNQRQLKLTYQ